MIDDTAEERRVTIEILTDQIVAGTERLVEHITAYAQALDAQLKLRKHLRRSHLIEVQ